MGVQAVCPVCDSTDYVLRQGQYFCRMCNTQSQELGTETVMDEETIPLELQGRNNALTIGRRRKGRGGRKRSLCEGVRWGTAEGYSWVLRGWVDQLNTIGVDVEIAVLQLWSLYLRELKLGFEKRGEKGMIGKENLSYREKWNLIGGPPGVLSYQTLASAKRRRMAVEKEDLEEDDEFGEETLQERRKRSKKRKHFFKSMSTADSGSEMDPKSPSAPSSAGDGESTSGGAESEDDFSESGHMTDPTLISQVMEKFVFGRQKHQKDPKNPYTRAENYRCSGVKDAYILPTILNLRQLAALLTLAVIARPISSITISDMVTLFNSEALAWKSALTFLPKAYAPTSREARKFSGEQQVFTTSMLSVLVFRLASFLHQQSNCPSVPKQINLVFSLPTMKNSENRKASFTFKSVLARFLRDLSLPSVLCKDINMSFKRLHLTNISATLQPYNPGNAGGVVWSKMKFPLVSKRILALILFTLKYHCGLDDQYEVYMSHNINKMASLSVGSDINYFNPLSWIRLSKFRLDHLMSINHSIREQYQSLAHVGTPDLVLPNFISKLRVEDKNHQGPGGEDQHPDKKFSDLTKLMSDLSVKVKPSENFNLSLEPLLDQSQQLLSSGSTKPGVKKCVEQLLKMTQANMRLCFELETCTLRNILLKNHGLKNHGQAERRIKLDKNWVATPDFRGTYTYDDGYSFVHSEERFRTQKKDQFLEMITSGRTRKSKFSVPQPKCKPDRFFKVNNKSYWFAHHYTMNQLKSGPGNKMVDEDLLTDQVLDLIPSNFSWILKYFSCYAHIPPLDLLEELNEIEKLFLMLDPEFFGLPKKLKMKSRFLPWKGGKVKVAKRKTKKVKVDVTDPNGG